MPSTAPLAATTMLALGAVPVSAAVRRVTSGRLRVPAYHGVDDVARFVTQLTVLGDYTPVSGDDIVAAVEGKTELPRSALWMTFDDGHPEVVECSQLLRRHGLTACLFVCPSVIDTTLPLWWQVREQAVGLGLVAPTEAARFALSRLKQLPDIDRRAEIDELARRVRQRTGSQPSRRQLTTAELDQWLADGHEIGNHTWDHPCLPRCDDDAARSQVLRAHEWLTDRGMSPRFLAYPNGDPAPAAAAAADELGYAASFLFDHRLADVRAPRHAMSRLRIDTSASPARARAILSGGHSGLYHALR